MSTARADTDGGNGFLARHELDELNPPPADAWGIVDAPFPPQPRTNPPRPFAGWPCGGSSPIGAGLPNQVPVAQVPGALGTALAATSLGQAMRSAGIYGGINLNNSSTSPRAAADLVFRL